MQTFTIVVLACLVVVVASAQYEHSPAVAAVQEALYDTPAHDSSPRTKRGLLLLKKKLLLGALGLKAAKVGAVGAGVVGAIALKSKSGHHHHAPPTYVEIHSAHPHPPAYIEVHSWH